MSYSATDLADARLAETVDRLVLTPQGGGRQWPLKARLEELLPGLDVRASAEGVAVPLSECVRLLDVEDEVHISWSSEARRAVENRELVARCHPRLREVVATLTGTPREQAVKALTGLADPEVLDDHQVRNVAALTHPDCYGMCLFDEQGAGKTVSVIYAFDLLAQRDLVDKALVVAPKSMVAEWEADLRRFKGALYTCRLVVGSRRQKLEALRSGADVLVTNFETVVSLENELRGTLSAGHGRNLLVVDESFLVKNLDARRTRALKRLREWASRAFVLCGTPAPNAPHDIVEQLNLADLGVTFDGIDVPDDRESALPVVAGALSRRGAYLRSLKRDVLPDLPAKAMKVVRLSLAPQQQQAYDAARDSLIVDLRATSDDEFRRRLASFIARRSALLQICSNPSRIIPGYEELPAKLSALDELLPQWIGKQGEKVVVWSFFTESLAAIVERYAEFGVVRYDGSTPVDARREAVRRFQEEVGTKLFVGNPAAAGAGLTLHAARLAVYESLSNQAAHYLQSLDRIHRRGQERAVEYVFLICEDSVEEDDFARMRGKERSAKELLSDPLDEMPTRDSMLASLMGSTA